MDPRLAAFLRQLVRKAHKVDATGALPKELEEKMMVDMSLQLEARLVAGLIDGLSPEAQTQYFDLVQDQPNQEQVMLFFSTHVPDAQQRIEQVLQQFEEDYLHITNN